MKHRGNNVMKVNTFISEENQVVGLNHGYGYGSGSGYGSGYGYGYGSGYGDGY